MKALLIALTLAAPALALRAADDAPPPPVPTPVADPAPPPKPAKPAPSKFAPHDVEVRLKDGSLVRGELKNTDAVELKTSFGALKFPLNEIYQITHAPSGAAGAADPVRIAAAIKDLKGGDRDKQHAAERLLEEAGAASMDALFDLRGGAPADLKPRVDALLKRVLTHKEPAGAAGALDGVRTAKFEARGTLQLDSLKISSRLGELSVKLTDVESIRWLAQGVQKSVDLEAEAVVRDWFDSGVDVNLGESVSVSATGHAVLFSSVQSTPAGTQNNDGQPFALGALIGRVGADGESFLIGDAKTWKPEGTGRLYLRIFAGDDVLQSNQNRSRGHYAARISSGPWSENAGPASSGDGE